MSEEIKFEQVFGPQELFNNRLNDVVMVIESYSGESWEFTSADVGMQYLIDETIREFSYSVAMRRIIKTPVWTVADQKAGRLPEVGAEIIELGTDRKCTVIWSNDEGEKIVVYFSNDNVQILHKNCFKPIETTEERAQRLRDEWCSECTSKYYPRGHKGFPEMIYDALLSGELQAPKGE